jgi:membrane-associated protease RseP (regulator of RpoE activity)
VIILFVLTCLSTFWAGACGWDAGSSDQLAIIGGMEVIKPVLAEGWQQGLLYMGAVMAILLTHEMGHFLQAVRYKIPARLPIFLPMPMTPIGTMGAVIVMQGSKADRREMFDIGISGPLAGLVVALPIAWLGILYAEPALPVGFIGEPIVFQDPLIMQWMTAWLRPDLPEGWQLSMSPLRMAGWVGMLITGLNMLPISQLDGGHVSYALLGRGAHWLARGVVLAGIAFIVITQQFNWIIMLALVIIMGTDHPPTANDHVPLGWKRYVLGWLSLIIPLLCFTPIPVRIG